MTDRMRGQVVWAIQEWQKREYLGKDYIHSSVGKLWEMREGGGHREGYCIPQWKARPLRRSVTGTKSNKQPTDVLRSLGGVSDLVVGGAANCPIL